MANPAPSMMPTPTSNQHNDIFIVVPAYNEDRSLAQVLAELRANYSQIVVVDDGSTDRTHELARSAGVHALRHCLNRGQGASLQTGIEFALRRGAAIIVTFDADGQHCVDDIQAMVEPIRRGECEITLGSRFLGDTTNMPKSRRFVLRLGVQFTRWVNRVQVTDAHNGFRAFSRNAAERIDITLDQMAHASEMIDLIRASGLPFREVPVRIQYTEYSLAKGQSTRGAFRIVLQYLLGRVFQ